MCIVFTPTHPAQEVVLRILRTLSVRLLTSCSLRRLVSGRPVSVVGIRAYRIVAAPAAAAYAIREDLTASTTTR